MNNNRSFTHGTTLLLLIVVIFGTMAPLIISVDEVQALSTDRRHYLQNAADRSVQETTIGWESWFIYSESSRWRPSELELVHETLDNTISALDDAGYDGRSLLAGYRFRRYHGEFVDGKDGRIALVRHNAKEIILADTAFKRLWGFYIYHELGHVVDKRLDRELSRRFITLAGSETAVDSEVTPDGFWLNEHARTDREEATADAFALLVVLGYTENPKPVFWHTPNTADYEKIAQTLEQTLRQSA